LAIHTFDAVLRESSVGGQSVDLSIFDEMSSDDRRERWLRIAG